MYVCVYVVCVVWCVHAYVYVYLLSCVWYSVCVELYVYVVCMCACVLSCVCGVCMYRSDKAQETGLAGLSWVAKQGMPPSIKTMS